MRVIIAVGLLGLLFLSCQEEPEVAPCILNEIELDEFNTLQYFTISGGRVYQLRQLFDNGVERDTLAFFQYTYFLDSLVVTNQLDPSLRPYMSVRYEGERILQVVRYFTSSGVLLLFDFEYGDAIVTVNLTRVASNGDELFATYANYYFDDADNVVRIEQFGIDEDDRSQFVLTQDRRFTYDNFVSPLEGLLLPFFANANVPGVEFFSKNNIIVVEDEDERIEIDYIYNEFGNVTRQLNPDGTELGYGYVNCP